MPEGMEKLLFAIVLFIILAVLYWFVHMPGQYLLPRLSLGLLLIVLLSQDFLAFQLCVVIVTAGLLLFFIFRILRHVIVVSGISKSKLRVIK